MELKLTENIIHKGKNLQRGTIIRTNDIEMDDKVATRLMEKGLAVDPAKVLQEEKEIDKTIQNDATIEDLNRKLDELMAYSKTLEDALSEAERTIAGLTEKISAPEKESKKSKK